MNDFTLQIFVPILQSDEAWDKKTRELRYGWVLEQAYQLRYALYEPVRDRLYKRAVHLCKLLTTIPEDAYQTILQDGVEVEYFEDDCLTARFCGEWDPSAYRVTYMESIWYGSFKWLPISMDFQTPSKEELLALNIHPHLVPEKKGQPSLF